METSQAELVSKQSRSAEALRFGKKRSKLLAASAGIWKKVRYFGKESV
jgi:hypothetical protein